MSQIRLGSAEIVDIGAPLLQRPLLLDLKTLGLGTSRVLDQLPAAVYVTDAEGRIAYFNEAAAALRGYRPRLNTDLWCGSWRLYRLDGAPLPHDQCPMAIALKEKRVVRGGEAVAERPDGTRVPFMAFPTPLFEHSGVLVGAVNMLIDMSERQRAERISHRLAAIIESSDDAIVSKDLNGVIATFNKGAERLFGYFAEEVIGNQSRSLFQRIARMRKPAYSTASAAASVSSISRPCAGARTEVSSTFP